MILDKSVLGVFAVLLTVLSILPYVWSTIKGDTRPHVFSWFIWFFACAVIFAAQHSDHAGPGAWASGMSAFLSLLVTLLCFVRKSDWSITRSDWISFIAALAIIPVWYSTHNVLMAAILATLIDSIAYYPTFRKSFSKPHQEMIFLYFVANLKHAASILAMTSYTMTTLVMPVTMLAINGALIALLIWRRRVLADKAAQT